jgi:hypothetical protein
MKHLEMDKKQIFVITPHSFIDVITNSSSELFVGNTDKSLEAIKEICVDLLAMHNKINGTCLSFEDVFEEPWIVDESNINDILNTLEGYNNDIPSEWEIEQSLQESTGLKRIYKYSESDEFKEHNEKIMALVKEEYNKQMNEKLPELKKLYMGRIVLASANSNSIPYEMFDYLENIFTNYDCRTHLG